MLTINTAFNKHWGYQKGPNYGFANSREACLSRDNYKCKCCGATKVRLEAHHIIYRSQGGSDELSNLITLCENCHKKLHDGKLKEFESKLSGKRKGTLKHATQMNSIRIQLLKHYPNAIETYGFVTKANRELSGLKKSHINDSIVIAMGCVAYPKYKTDFYYKKKHVAKGDYQQAKYRSKSKNGFNRKKLTTSKIHGLLRYDKVSYLGNEYFIKGRSSTSPFRLMNIEGNEITFEDVSKTKYAKTKSLKRVSARSTTLCIKQFIVDVV